MRPSALSERLDAGLLGFAWDEWGQMGVLASPSRRSSWAQDPEALLVFTLDVARGDARLFDEVLDWLLVNESLLSVRRLRAICRDHGDERLLDAALGWVSSSRPRARLLARGGFDGEPENLFTDLFTPIHEPDPAFLAQGFLRPALAPTGKAGTPDLRAPINLAFRLRQVLGVSTRAELVRHLLTVQEPVSLDALTDSAAFAKRNVQEALTSLHAAGVVALLGGRGAQRYVVDPEAWSGLLGIGLGELPSHRDWRQLLGGLRAIRRWLAGSDVEDLSEYLLASRTRDLLEEVRADFEHVGISVGRTPGAGAWTDLEALVNAALRIVDVDPERAYSDVGAPKPFIQFAIYPSGGVRWSLIAPSGRIVAVSPAFDALRRAQAAADRFIDAADSSLYEIYADSAGQYRWRAVDVDGSPLAVSAEAFTAKTKAEAAAAEAQELAGSAVSSSVP